VFPVYIPRTYPCLPVRNSSCSADPYAANPPIEAKFKNFLAYKNEHNGAIGESLGAVSFMNVTAIDNNMVGIEISTSD
jgi:hypothetical protein